MLVCVCACSGVCTVLCVCVRACVCVSAVRVCVCIILRLGVYGRLPEWLTGSPAKRLCYARLGSNPRPVVFLHPLFLPAFLPHSCLSCLRTVNRPKTPTLCVVLCVFLSIFSAFFSFFQLVDFASPLLHLPHHFLLQPTLFLSVPYTRTNLSTFCILHLTCNTLETDEERNGRTEWRSGKTLFRCSQNSSTSP